MLSRHLPESWRHFLNKAALSWQGGTFPGWDKKSKPSMTRRHYPPGAVSDDDEQHSDSSQQGSVGRTQTSFGRQDYSPAWETRVIPSGGSSDKSQCLDKGGLLALPYIYYVSKFLHSAGPTQHPVLL